MSSDVQEQIISAIFERRPIWNSKDVNHKNRRIINQLWEEIKNELNIEVTDLKKKWKNLKDHYRKELKKNPAPRSGDAGNVNQPSNWQYFSQLRFLQDEVVPNVTEGNLSRPEVSNQISNDSFETEDISGENSQEDTTGHNEESSIYPQQPSTSSQEAPVSSQEASTSLQEISTPPREASASQRSRKKRTANDIRTEFLELERKRIRLLENDLSNQSRNEASRNENKSDDYYFFMSLLPQMEKFTPFQKFRVRQKINQALLDELSVNESTYPSNESYMYGYSTQQ
ncbi:transcription factor Adf-1-like [Amyelois transitella]|uniref:transcription factor Adf-1-like n=1 Tax=Amyelois transitella TaxID=680683 RepID=UPI00067BB169|nr:transcription factor Adf-1-like [Amyelois transitella]XP_060806335.1 transcription factor Adf-1-like [Amyelois transitella]XP_060806393.1 transcription factor Adf-1-like [Amyelois transitella]XP_060808750.1 transcription factor Adf-1-like [Amyelois transitella]XP_060809363.1 transcription factor Adf-1-like [Amyelois transitella]